MILHKPFHFPSLNVLTHSGLHHARPPSELKAKSADQVADTKAEVLERFLIRSVPPACGALLGGQFDLPLLGLFLGFVVAVQFDLHLKEQSLIRRWLRAKPVSPPGVHGQFFNHR